MFVSQLRPPFKYAQHQRNLRCSWWGSTVSERLLSFAISWAEIFPDKGSARNRLRIASPVRFSSFVSRSYWGHSCDFWLFSLFLSYKSAYQWPRRTDDTWKCLVSSSGPAFSWFGAFRRVISKSLRGQSAAVERVAIYHSCGHPGNSQWRKTTYQPWIWFYQGCLVVCWGEKME